MTNKAERRRRRKKRLQKKGSSRAITGRTVTCFTHFDRQGFSTVTREFLTIEDFHWPWLPTQTFMWLVRLFPCVGSSKFSRFVNQR